MVSGQQWSESSSLYAVYGGGCATGRKKLDMHQLMKNPSLIINDSVQMACDKLWLTIKHKIIFQYNLTSDQIGNICNWINLNLKFLGQLVQTRNQNQSQHWTLLTVGQQKFLNLNLELISELCMMQVSQIQLLVPKMSEQEKLYRKHNRKRNGRKLMTKT
jgi:hypothetical protein